MTEKKTETEELLEKLSKSEELLKKISKYLEDPDKGIEPNKERESQSDIAKLQADSPRMSERKVNETKPSETKSKKMVRRSFAVALGIICILLIAGLGGAITYYTMKLNDKENQIDSANNTINRLMATMADQNNTIVSSNANITNLTNEENQLQTWLEGNETLLNQTQILLSQTQTWLNGNATLLQAENITSYEVQISSLNTQITQLKTWLSGNITAYQNEIILYTNEVNQYNNYVADHHNTDEDYNATSSQNTNLTNQVNDLNSTLNLEKSTVWIDNQTISQPASQYTNWTESVNYAGYVSVGVQSSNVTSIHVAVTYSAYGMNFTQEDDDVSVGGTVVFPILPSNITVFVGNGNLGFQGGASETVTITYYY